MDLICHLTDIQPVYTLDYMYIVIILVVIMVYWVTFILDRFSLDYKRSMERQGFIVNWYNPTV